MLMLILKILAIVIFVVLVTMYIYPVFSVSGKSMYPTLKDKDIVVCKRLFIKSKKCLKVGDMYILNSPSESKEYAIKRLAEVTEDNKCYFLGDNPNHSYDSRDYGYVKANQVMYKVIRKF